MRTLIVLAGLISMVATGASAQGVTVDSSQQTAPGQGTLKPGDTIRLKIWREPDLTGDFLIDASGTVVLPKLGPMKATGAALPILHKEIVDGYLQYLSQTSIEVTFLRRIQVLGAVKTPGLYPVDQTMTVGDAIALAGGVSSDGNSKKIQLVRDGQTLSGDLSQNTQLADTPLESGDQLKVPYRSWLSRNGYLAGTLLSAAITIVYVFVRH